MFFVNARKNGIDRNKANNMSTCYIHKPYIDFKNLL